MTFQLTIAMLLLLRDEYKEESLEDWAVRSGDSVTTNASSADLWESSDPLKGQAFVDQTWLLFEGCIADVEETLSSSM